MLYLSPEDFIDWIKTQERDRVGLSLDTTECPVARYMYYKGYFPGKNEGFEVDSLGVRVFFEGLSDPVDYFFPDWVTNFIKSVDGEYTGNNFQPESRRVGRGEALAIMQRITGLVG